MQKSKELTFDFSLVETAFKANLLLSLEERVSKNDSAKTPEWAPYGKYVLVKYDIVKEALRPLVITSGEMTIDVYVKGLIRYLDQVKAIEFVDISKGYHFSTFKFIQNSLRSKFQAIPFTGKYLDMTPQDMTTMFYKKGYKFNGYTIESYTGI